jgi:hypothetical protein
MSRVQPIVSILAMCIVAALAAGCDKDDAPKPSAKPATSAAAATPPPAKSAAPSAKPAAPTPGVPAGGGW